MKTIIALLALFLAPQIVTAQSLPISLPEGVTIATATPQQVSDAVAAAIKANPSNAEGIATAVAKAIAGLPNAKALATALATAVASNVPAANVASVIGPRQNYGAHRVRPLARLRRRVYRGRESL